MKRAQKTVAYLIGGVIAGFAIAAIVLLTISRTEFGMERARRYALKWLTNRVDGTVQIGGLGGNGLLGGVTVRNFSIIDKLGRPFMRADSVQLNYNWRTLVKGEVVIDHSTIYNTQIYFEQLPGDSIWNFQHVFPDRSKPGAPPAARRLILLNDMRIVNGTAIVRMPLDSIRIATERDVLDTVPGGVAKVMRFDSLHGRLSRVIWESPTEEGKLIDVRTLSGRGFVWRDAMHVRDMRGTVTLRDTIVAFDIPDARLPSSRASLLGRVIMEEGQNFYDVRVDSRSFTFPDLHWLYPRLPNNGGGSGTLRIQSQRPKGTLWLATNTRLAAQGTRVAGSFGVVTGADSLYFTNVDLRASPLNLQLIQAMLPNKLPIDGLLVGTVELKGGLSSLDTRGDLKLSNHEGTQSVKWRGRVDVRHGLGARDFTADVDRFDLALVNSFARDFKLRGQLTGHIEASGNTRSSMQFAADIHHYLSGYTSSFTGKGTYTGGAQPGLNVELNALPLSLEEVSASYPALERLRGEARGPIRLTGALDNMEVHADLETLGGRARIDGRLMRTGARPRYAGDATLYSFRLDRLVNDLPETSLDGTVSFDVTATSPEDANGFINAQLAHGSVRDVDFRDARASLKINDGALRVDTMIARTMLGALSASGTLGMRAGRTGSIAFTIRTDSLTLLDDSAHTPTAGKVRGNGTVTGSVQSFDLDANLNIEKLLYGSLNGDRVSATVKGTTLGTDAGRIVVTARADSLVAFGEQVDTTAATFTYAAHKGDLNVAAGSADGTEYKLAAGMESLTNGLLFTLRELQLGKRSAPWTLRHAATIQTDDHGLTADTIEIMRGDAGRISGAGRIAWHDLSHAPEPGQASDFRLEFTGVPFAEFALVTSGTANVKGTLDGHVRVTGNAVAPLLDADATVNGFGVEDASVDFMTGSFTYANERINARIDAEKDGRRVLFADGVVPFNLAFVPVKNRRLHEPLRFVIQADSLPATFLTAPVPGFSGVDGRLDGTISASGPTSKPQFSGSLTLKDGSAGWDITGVRYHDVGGTISLDNNRAARVDANLRTSDGAAHVTGTIDFAKPQNPGFDLAMNAQNFLAARRRDADLTASGDVQLRGHYRQPVISGNIEVSQGALYLDEMYRRYQIVELDNPLLYDVVDTSLVSLRTILPRTTNPFIKNLVVDSLHVGVGRGGWLRSRDLNVEVSGDVTIAFLLNDTLLSTARSAQDLILTGTLRAVRGTYQLYYPGIARQFAIREGTIEFPGTPGVDPNLGFNAVYRARSNRGDPIDIVAVVGGTLRNTSVHLTSDEEPPISESDLASYLFFGVPTYELSASQSAAVNQAASGLNGPGIAALADPLKRALTSSGFGYLASGLQSFAQNYGLLDYVALTSAEDVGIHSQSALASLFAGTRLELGRYWGDKVYIAYSQRLSSTGYRSPGVRVEWRLVPTLTAEVFAEDRFARSYDFGIETTSSFKKVFGFFLYREWGY